MGTNCTELGAAVDVRIVTGNGLEVRVTEVERGARDVPPTVRGTGVLLVETTVRRRSVRPGFTGM